MIGAGVGGLAASLRLAARGCKVRVVEALPRVGGKLHVLEDAGFKFDTGPSLLTLPWVFEDLFAAAGERLEDHVQLKRLEPVCRYFYADGSGFDASADLPTMMQNLEKFSPGAGQDFMAFFGHAAKAWRGSRKAFLESSISGPQDFLRDGVPWQDLTALLPWPSLHGLAKQFFTDPRLQQFVGRYATYTGSSPYRAPGTLSTVLYAEFAFGAWYVQGGLYCLAEALEKVARKLGVEFRLNTRVSRILCNEAKSAVSAVELENGEKIFANAIVCNADAATLYQQFLPTQFDPRPKNVEPSLSGFVMMLGLEGSTPGLAHHNIFFSKDYAAEFKNIFNTSCPSQEPTIYVCVSSKSDVTQAPPGMENWFVLVNAPSLGKVNWNEEKDAYAARILEVLAEHGHDVRGRIRVQHLLTPQDIEARYGAWRGGIYGTSSNGAQAAFLRPSNRAPKLAGLYLASGSAHPGGGLPLVALSGKLAAEAFLADFALKN